MDNFISRGTAHFLTCKEPDYQQSLFNVLSTVSIFLIVIVQLYGLLVDSSKLKVVEFCTFRITYDNSCCCSVEMLYIYIIISQVPPVKQNTHQSTEQYSSSFIANLYLAFVSTAHDRQKHRRQWCWICSKAYWSCFPELQRTGGSVGRTLSPTHSWSVTTSGDFLLKVASYTSGKNCVENLYDLIIGNVARGWTLVAKSHHYGY